MDFTHDKDVQLEIYHSQIRFSTLIGNIRIETVFFK